MRVSSVSNVPMNINELLIQMSNVNGKDVKPDLKISMINRVSRDSISMFNDWMILVRFDQTEEEMNTNAHQLQTQINQLSDRLIETVGNCKKTYMDIIEKHRQTSKPT